MIPRPCRARWCNHCGRNVLTVKVRVNRQSLRQCDHCGGRTSKREPKPLRRGKRPIWAKRAEVKAAGDLTDEQWVEIGRFYGWMCAYCEVNRATEQDHIRPISRGGTHQAFNVCPACHTCNSAKGSSLRWEPKRKHPYMVKAQAQARAKALEESFAVAGFEIGGER